MAARRRGLNGSRLLALALLPWLLAGCTSAAGESPAEVAARRELGCTEAGFAAATPEFRLCLMLQQTNERLAAVERQLQWLNQQTVWPRAYFGPGWW